MRLMTNRQPPSFYRRIVHLPAGRRGGPVALILAGFALRVYRLGSQSLWYDETVSAYLAGRPVPELVAHTARDIHPPAYYLLLHIWTALAGNTEFALAFLSLGFGLLLISLTCRLGRDLAGKHVAVWAAALTAVSPYHIWYSQEVRMYTLAAGLGLAAVYCAGRGFGTGNRKWWAGYIFFTALGMYTLYYLAFLLLAANLVLLVAAIRAKNRPGLARLFLANGLAVVVYLPWLPVAWRQATQPPVPPWRNPAGISLWPILVESWSALSLGQSVDAAAVWPVLLLTLGLALAGVVYLRALRPRSFSLPVSPALLLPAYTFGPLLLIYLFSLVTPLYHVRYIFTYSPAFYILLAAGLVWLARHTRWLALAVAGVLLVACGYSLYRFHFNPAYRADDYRSAVQFIQENWQPGDVLMANAGYTYTAFVYYARLPGLERQRLVPYRRPQTTDHPILLQTGTVGGSAQLGWGDPRADFYAMSRAGTLAALEQLSRDYHRLWLLRSYDTVTDPSGLIRGWLAEHAIPIEDRLFSGPSNIRGQGFLLNGPARQPDAANKPVSFSNGLRLAGWYLPDHPWQPGQTIYVKLWWQATAPPSADYKMSLKLWAPTGALAAQGRDEWPGGTLHRATTWTPGQVVYHPGQITLPPDIPPGRYWLNVELYHPQTLQPLPRLDGQDPVVTLGPVVVP